MKHSIRLKMTIILVGVIVGTFVIFLLISNLFLESYYIDRKEKLLLENYRLLGQIHWGEPIEQDVRDKLNEKLENTGSSLIITNESGYVEFWYGSRIVLLSRYREIIYGSPDPTEKRVNTAPNCYMRRVIETEDVSGYLEMHGLLPSNRLFLMRIPYYSISENVKIANRFFGVVGIGVILVSSIFIIIILHNFTKPILQLSVVAEKMSRLDFQAKYTVKKKDEIGILGDSINMMSEKLEHTIVELKEANIRLEKDLERRMEIDEMRTEFLSNVSHELKTPIALIQGYAEGLSDGVNEDAESREFYCDVIVDEAHKMNKMVSKLLTLNQIEFGSDPLNLEYYDIVKSIKEYISTSEIILDQKEVNVEYTGLESLYVWADQFQIDEVIMNFLSNAINHIDYDRIIRLDVQSKENKAIISVFNTGKHIPEESLEKVWVKFYKVDKARTREYGGSGIGLSIVKAIMDAHNEKCYVRNVDAGVEFSFTLDCGQPGNV